MERVRTQEFVEAVAHGLSYVPAGVLKKVGSVHWFEGDLSFAGYSSSLPESHYMSAFSTRHLQIYNHADRLCPTICFTGVPWQSIPDPHDVVHELGHSLQTGLGSYEDSWGWPVANRIGLPTLGGPITTYEEETYCEQFCEAMVAWLLPAHELTHRYSGSAERLQEDCPELLGLLNEWAGWPADQPPKALQG